MKTDKKHLFRFVATSPSDSVWLILQEQLAVKNAVVLYMNGQWYFQSTATLKICAKLSFPFNVLTVFGVIPAILRDPIYNLIARNRYRWFGQKSTCTIPSAAEKAYFIPCPTLELLKFPQKK
jgi:predicted DCC family thiol-disulfide oxidoreductase YuxK